MKCEYQCHEVGGPWIAENPDCPVHGRDAPKESTGQVYIGFECSYNGLDMWRNVDRVFATESDAQNWVEQKSTTEWEWREYDEWEIE